MKNKNMKVIPISLNCVLMAHIMLVVFFILVAQRLQKIWDMRR